MIEAALSGVAASVISGIAVYFAAKAEKNSRPVSNGAIPHIREDLRELRKLMTDHLKDHTR